MPISLKVKEGESLLKLRPKGGERVRGEGQGWEAQGLSACPNILMMIFLQILYHIEQNLYKLSRHVWSVW